MLVISLTGNWMFAACSWVKKLSNANWGLPNLQPAHDRLRGMRDSRKRGGGRVRCKSANPTLKGRQNNMDILDPGTGATFIISAGFQEGSKCPWCWTSCWRKLPSRGHGHMEVRCYHPLYSRSQSPISHETCLQERALDFGEEKAVMETKCISQNCFSGYIH
ncbi:hypothetical protein AOLI_G00180540 [Acnodon oligacanthus]